MLITRMNAGKVAAVAVLACLTAGSAHAAELVTTSVSASPKSVAPGGHGTLTITLNIAPDAHVNAHKASEGFIPTSFAASKAAGVKLGAAKYPVAHEVTTAGIKQSVYQGAAKIQVPFTVAKTAKRGTVSVGGKLTYQACNTSVCFPPKTINLQAPVTIK
jgi:thiol:disulfide interchange protein DsbD